LVEDMEAFYARLTVYVSASYRESDGRGGEGAGLALSEASWSGLPVVATRSGGTDEVVIDEVTGLLVPPAAPTELARALRRILRDPELAASLGEAGRDFAQTRFSPSRCAAQLFEEWRSVVAEREPPAAR
jgi:glycosyltransferase involved in cell wall biosynthesis